MYCMKCGREIEEGQVFCPDCLLVMAKYPVKPGTAVLLPKRREASFVKRAVPRRKLVTPEEQIRKLRKTIRTMFIVWLVTFLLFCAALYPAVLYLKEDMHFLPGQNYSVIGSQETTEG